MQQSCLWAFAVLPFEVRLHIYQALFTFPGAISLEDLHDADHRWVWQALEVNRELRREGSKVLFGHNTFLLEIFTKPRFVDLLAISKRAEIVSLPRLNLWNAARRIEYNIAIPLPDKGVVCALSSVHLTSSIFQSQGSNGWHGVTHDCAVVSPGPAYQFADLEIPQQSWHARNLIRRVEIVAPKLIGKNFWHEAELACMMVEVLSTKYFNNLQLIRLDLTCPLDFYGTFGIQPQNNQTPLSFVARSEQFEVVGRSARPVDVSICQSIKESAQVVKAIKTS